MALSLRNPNGYDGSPATQYKQGIVRLATDPEATAGLATNVAVTPAQMAAGAAADFAAPPAIGSTTPNAGTFTDLTVNDTFAMDGGAVTDNIGQVTLVAGVGTVLNTNIAATDRILLSRAGIGASTALGTLSYVINAGVSFVVTSRNPADATAQTADVSVISYVIVRQV